MKSQRCLDLGGTGSGHPGPQIATSTCLFGDKDNQMFKKQKQGNGFYRVHEKSGLGRDAEGVDAARRPVDPELALNPGSPTDDMIWSFG